MPHYHNFGWYYFVKYVLGFAGMLFLYSGLLKENEFSCSCGAEVRELSRRKGDNNESCPTGDRTDARAKMELNAPSHVGADAKGKRLGPPTPAIRRWPLEKSVVSPRNVKPECPRKRELRVYRAKFRTSLSSSDGNVETEDRKKHRSGCRRASKHRGGRYRSSTLLDGTSSQSSEGTPVRLHAESNGDRRILNAIARANVRVRNSFAEQEYRELEALACSIFNRGISGDVSRLQGTLSPSSNSSSSIRLRTEAGPVGIRLNSQKSSGYDFQSPQRRKVRRRTPFRECRKCRPESASSSLASVRSRSGSVYLTASSRGQRTDCKIHGRRYTANIEKSAARVHSCRFVEESDESDDEINRRKTGEQRVTRYRSATISML